LHPARSVDSRLSARWLALLAGLVIALYLCWRMLQPFVNVLLWAFVLFVVFAPVHTRIERRLKSPAWSAIVSTLIVVVTILGPITFITLAVIAELRDLAVGIDTWHLPTWDPNLPIIGPVLARIDTYVDIDQFRSPQFLREHLESWSGALASQTLGLVGGALSMIVQTLLVIFTLYCSECRRRCSGES
jgi:predicted PurR-regulated permease PerM